MNQHPANFYQYQRLNAIADYVRSMGRNCYIDEGKLAIEIEHQTPNGAIYTTTEHVKSKEEAMLLLQDD
jgi:hypothetical protein